MSHRLALPSILLVLVLPILTIPTHALDRTCPLGEGIVRPGTGCVPCPPGTYASIFSSKCTRCPRNTFAKSSGTVSSHLCLPCGPTATSKRGSRSCTTCPSGRVAARCPGRCVRCPPGTRVSNDCGCEKCDGVSFSKGFNVEECTACPEGMRSDGTRTGCVKADCPPGRVWMMRISAACYSCIGNTYRAEGMEKCEECPSRMLPNTAKSGCEPCPAGSYVRNALRTFTPFFPKCQPCPAGKTTRGAGKAICRGEGEACPSKSFKDADGDCDFCDKGFRYLKAERKCVECPPGSVSKGGLSTVCKPCGAKGIVHADDRSRCDCPPGYSLRGGKCVLCEAGRYKPASFRYLSGRCSPCGFNEYSGVGASECKKCASGFSSYASGGKKCVPDKVCYKGLVVPGWDNYQYPGVQSCVSPVTGCPLFLKARVKFGELFCVNRKGKIVCPPDFKFSKRGFGHGDGPKCILK